MARPITMGDLADVLRHGEAIVNRLPDINESQFIGYLNVLATDAAERAKFRRALNGLEMVLGILRRAPLRAIEE